MRKLASRLLLLIGILVAINVVIASQLPVTWAEPIIDFKYRDYKTRSDDIDVLFLGSSRTFRHVSPSQFAEQVAPVTGEITTYNLGSPNYYYPKTHRLLEDILNDKPENLDIVFLELNLQNSPASSVRHTTVHKYWYTWDLGTMLARSVFDTRTLRSVQLGYAYTHAISILEKYLNLGVGPDVIEFIVEHDTASQTNSLGEGLDGFSPLNNERANAEQKQRHRQLVDNPAQLTKRTADARRAFQNRDDFQRYSLDYHDTVEGLLALAEANEVKLYFVLPPRLSYIEYQAVLPVFERLPDGRLVDLADPTIHPEFYSMQYSWDRGHMNDEGADLYTKRLADAFIYLETDYSAATEMQNTSGFVSDEIEQSMINAVEQWESGEWEGLRGELTRLAISDSQLSDPYFYLGLLDESEENWESADANYQLAAQRPKTLTIGHSDVPFRRAWLTFQTIRPISWELVGPYAEHALEEDDFRYDTDIIPIAHYFYAQGLATTGRGIQALEEFRIVVEQYATELDEPSLYGALVGYGEYTWLVEGNLEKAVELLEQAIELSESSIFAYMRLGKVYRLADKPELAIEAYEQVLGLNPNHRAASDFLAQLQAVQDE